MPRRRRTALVGLAALAAVAALAYVAGRDGDDDPSAVAAVAGTTTTTAGPPTTKGRVPRSVGSIATPSTVGFPAFVSSIETVTATQLGSSWRPGCPLPVEQLRAVSVTHVGYDGAAHTGRLIVDAAHAERIATVFRDLYAARFPIQRIEPVDRYGSDDQASMRANNTSAFNCRTVAGSTSWSEHAYGRAIDLNPLVNPYVKGTSVDPPEGAPYADRTRTDPGMIHADDAAVRAFAAQGWTWGGYWSNGQDYQHFSASGR